MRRNRGFDLPITTCIATDYKLRINVSLTEPRRALRLARKIHSGSVQGMGHRAHRVPAGRPRSQTPCQLCALCGWAPCPLWQDFWRFECEITGLALNAQVTEQRPHLPGRICRVSGRVGDTDLPRIQDSRGICGPAICGFPESAAKFVRDENWARLPAGGLSRGGRCVHPWSPRVGHLNGNRPAVRIPIAARGRDGRENHAVRAPCVSLPCRRDLARSWTTVIDS